MKIGFCFPDINFATDVSGSNFLLPTFSIGCSLDFQVANLLQWTLTITTLFVYKDLAVKSNLLLYRNLIWTRLNHEYWILLHVFCFFLCIICFVYLLESP